MKKIAKKQAAILAIFFLSAFIIHAEEKTFSIPGKGDITRDVTLIEERTFDNNERLESLKQSTGSIIKYKYNKNGQIISVSDSNGYKEKFDYNKNGKIIHKETSADFEEWYDYTPEGKLLAKRNSNLTGTQYLYDENNKLTKIKNFEGDVELYSEEYQYNEDGLMVKKVSSYGEEITFTYNEDKKITKKTYADGTYTDYVYSDKGILVYSHTVFEDTEEESFFVYEFDENGKRKKMQKYQYLSQINN